MFKKGDKVYSILMGWGEVEDQDPDGDTGVRFTDGTYSAYMPDGKKFSYHLRPELYHTEPVITVPKRKVEHTGWIVIFESNERLNYRVTSMIYPTKESAQERIYEVEKGTLQQITYYTEE